MEEVFFFCANFWGDEKRLKTNKKIQVEVEAVRVKITLACTECKQRNYNFTKENVDTILKSEIGKTFVRVLEDAGVYKCTPEGREAFLRFVNSIK